LPPPSSSPPHAVTAVNATITAIAENSNKSLFLIVIICSLNMLVKYQLIISGAKILKKLHKNNTFLEKM
jgi:hypothetical protein